MGAKQRGQSKASDPKNPLTMWFLWANASASLSLSFLTCQGVYDSLLGVGGETAESWAQGVPASGAGFKGGTCLQGKSAQEAEFTQTQTRTRPPPDPEWWTFPHFGHA